MRGVMVLEDAAQLRAGTLTVNDRHSNDRHSNDRHSNDRHSAVSPGSLPPQRARFDTFFTSYQPDETHQPLPFIAKTEETQPVPDNAQTGEALPATFAAVDAADAEYTKRPRIETVALDRAQVDVADILARYAESTTNIRSTALWTGNVAAAADANTDASTGNSRGTAELTVDLLEAEAAALPFTPSADPQTTTPPVAPQPPPPSPAPTPSPAPAAPATVQPPPMVMGAAPPAAVLRPPNPLSGSPTMASPALLTPLARAPSATPVPQTVQPPVEPLKIGPLAGSLEETSAALEEPAATSEKAPAAEATPAEKLTLERVAAIEAARNAEPDEHKEVMRRFEVDEASLKEASQRIHQDEMLALEQGDRGPLDRYDRAYVAQLEEQRGPITIDEHATIEVAIERNILARVLLELRLPASSVVRIRRVLMRKFVGDMALSKRLRERIDVARRAGR